MYHEVGLIITTFMAGLALGAGVANRYPRYKGARFAFDPGNYGSLRSIDTLGLIDLTTHPRSRLSLLDACFPLAVALTKGSVGCAVRLIYGAHLVRGCLGAALVSGLFVPILGIPQTRYSAALLALARAALLI